MDAHLFLDILESEYETEDSEYSFTALKKYVLEIETENKNLKEIIDIQRHNLAVMRRKK